MAQVVGAGDRYCRARDAGVACAAAVVVGVVEHKTRQARGLEFTKIVLDAVHAGAQHDVAQQVVAGGAALRAHAVLAVEVAGRLGLRQGVGARAQGVEAVAAVGGGGGRQADRVAQVVRAGQRDGGAGDAGVASAAAVVVGVGKHEARQAGRRHFFNKIVAR